MAMDWILMRIMGLTRTGPDYRDQLFRPYGLGENVKTMALLARLFKQVDRGGLP